MLEDPAKVLHLSAMGDREYLSPNLVGLQDLISTFLPWKYIYLNVVDAFRELVNGIRYEILFNAIDTTRDNDTSHIVCRLIIDEKPWKQTAFRELVYSNCTDNNEHRVGVYLNDISDRYELKPVFRRERMNITADDIKKIEQEIVPKVPEEDLNITKVLAMDQNNTNEYQIDLRAFMQDDDENLEVTSASPTTVSYSNNQEFRTIEFLDSYMNYDAELRNRGVQNADWKSEEVAHQQVTNKRETKNSLTS